MDPKAYAKPWRLGEGKGSHICKICGYAGTTPYKVKNASRKTGFNSETSWIYCGDYACGRELQSRVDLENTYSGTHTVMEMIGHNGHTWVENTKEEWHPENPHDALFLEPHRTSQVTIELLNKANFDANWEGDD